MKLHTLSRRTFCKLLSLGAIAGIGGAIPFMSTNTKTFASANTTPKSLIVYFSHSGNTKKIAQFIQETLNCDSFEVKPAKPYPTDYDTLVNLAREEKNNHFRPELAGTIPNTGNYQTIFVGYPSWWGTMPMPLFTFFEQINCSGKTIVPFTTHEGSRFGQSLRDLQTLCPDAVLLDGFETRGSRSANAKQDVQTWLKTINIAQ
jgi:Flavodoxins